MRRSIVSIQSEKTLGSYDDTFIYDLTEDGGYVSIVIDQNFRDQRYMMLRPREMMKLAMDIIKAYG